MTHLEMLKNTIECETDLKKVSEIRYRIYVLEEEKALELALEELDTLDDCKTHRNLLMCLVDMMCSPIYRKHRENEKQYLYEEFHSLFYSRCERKFYTIFDVESYKNLFHSVIPTLIAKWWEYRENICSIRFTK